MSKIRSVMTLVVLVLIGACVAGVASAQSERDVLYGIMTLTEFTYDEGELRFWAKYELPLHKNRDLYGAVCFIPMEEGGMEFLQDEISAGMLLQLRKRYCGRDFRVVGGVYTDADDASKLESSGRWIYDRVGDNYTFDPANTIDFLLYPYNHAGAGSREERVARSVDSLENLKKRLRQDHPKLLARLIAYYKKKPRMPIVEHPETDEIQPSLQASPSNDPPSVPEPVQQRPGRKEILRQEEEEYEDESEQGLEDSYSQALERQQEAARQLAEAITRKSDAKSQKKGRPYVPPQPAYRPPAPSAYPLQPRAQYQPRQSQPLGGLAASGQDARRPSPGECLEIDKSNSIGDFAINRCDHEIIVKRCCDVDKGRTARSFNVGPHRKVSISKCLRSNFEICYYDLYIQEICRFPIKYTCP